MKSLLRLCAFGALLLAPRRRRFQARRRHAAQGQGERLFLSCKAGADKAARELGVELRFDGPTDTNAAKQNEIIENWITAGVDVIAVAAENREGISTALRKAQKAGISVVTFDADAMPDARSFFVNQATPRGSAAA
jgi:ABC-type sugar transport system substrate-binding protein